MNASHLSEIAARYNLKRRSGGYAGPCPKCGGASTSDKFVIKDDGGFKCYGCDFKGDVITWLRTMEGKTCPEAHEAAGIDCRAATCSVRGTCRLGDGSGKVKRRSARSVEPPRPSKSATLPSTTTKTPKETWAYWASGLVAQAVLDLQEQADTLQWLADRGIPATAVKRFALGWLAHDRRVLRASIGLHPKEGKDKLWVPGGLVIPIFTSADQLHRIRIRRTEADRAKFLSERKYMWIEGSGTDPLVIRPASGTSRGVVVVEAELDAMAVAHAHPEVTVIALGTVAGGMPEWLRRYCDNAPVVLVALDADAGKEGALGAGPKAIASWVNTYRQAKFWPVPAGKDPGDYVKDHGGDLRSWIEAGLPPVVSAPIPAIPHDQPLSLDAGYRGDRGKVVESPENNTPMAAFIDLLGDEAGSIWCDEYDTGIRYHRAYPMNYESGNRRQRIADAVYGEGMVAGMLHLLPPGNYSASQLKQFFTGA